MKTVTMYVTLDGEAWTTKEGAVKHAQGMLRNVAELMASDLVQFTKYPNIRDYLMSTVGLRRAESLWLWAKECHGDLPSAESEGCVPSRV